jgi:hypothetical protein
MNRTHALLNASCILIAVALSFPVRAAKPREDDASPQAGKAGVPSSGLWHDRGPMASLNILGGPGGTEHQPSGKFTFVKEDKNGTSPKFDVTDEQGVRWKVKLGAEVQSETAATRLVWAAGYFADEDYYLPEIHVSKMPVLERGKEFVAEGGLVRGVRLERKRGGEKKTGNWSWFKNPFVGTKELDGLKIMMALINNWDLKEINNAIYSEKSGGARYSVSDLGASFGETGNSITRSKSNLNDYSESKFVQKVTEKHVDFYMNSRPFVLSAFDVPNYATRTHMQDIVKEIPLAHARWLGKLLEPLSDEQLRDCFRSAGYSPEEVNAYAAIVKERIRDLNRL